VLPSLLFILLPCATDALAAPAIAVNPNPVLVAAGQTEGETTLAWSTEGPGGFVWMSVDGGDMGNLSYEVYGHFEITRRAQ